MTFNAQLFPACASQATEITNVCSINYVVVVDSRPRCTHRNTPGKAIHAEPIAGAHTHGPTNTQAGVGLWKKRLKFYFDYNAVTHSFLAIIFRPKCLKKIIETREMRSSLPTYTKSGKVTPIPLRFA